jgi:hypothetical protein
MAVARSVNLRAVQKPPQTVFTPQFGYGQEVRIPCSVLRTTGLVVEVRPLQIVWGRLTLLVVVIVGLVVL